VKVYIFNEKSVTQKIFLEEVGKITDFRFRVLGSVKSYILSSA